MAEFCRVVLNKFRLIFNGLGGLFLSEMDKIYIKKVNFMQKKAQNIDCRLLAEAIKTRLKERKIVQSEAAEEIGLSGSTLSRIINQIGVPTRDILIRVCRWLNMPPERVLRQTRKVIYYQNESTPEIIAELLRKDKTITPEIADYLADLFRTAYSHLSRIKQGEKDETK